MINKPSQAAFHKLLNKEIGLRIYLTLNFTAIGLAYFIDWYIFFFEIGFAFMLWLYSHKLRKMKFLSEISATTLALSPFFAIVLFYERITLMSLLYLGYIFMLTYTREVTKKLSTTKGDTVYGDKSLAITLGENKTKTIITFLVILTVLPIVFLFPLYHNDILALIYFGGVCFTLSLGVLIVLISKQKSAYKIFNNLLKALIISAILALLLLKY